MSNDNDSRSLNEDGPVPNEPVGGVAPSIGRVLVAALRLVGFVVMIAGAVVLKLTLRRNPGVAMALGLAMFAGLALMFTAAAVAKALAADARRSKPSPVIGTVKLGLGAAVIAAALVNVDPHGLRLGLFSAVPYGWTAVLPYGIAIAVGSLGVMSGALALAGRRGNRGVRGLIALALVVAVAFGLPAISPVRFIAQAHSQGANMMITSADGKYVVIETSGGTSSVRATVFRADPVANVREISSSGFFTVPLALGPDGRRLACMEKDKVRIFQTESGQQLAEHAIAGVDDDTGVALSYVRDGTQLVMTVARRAHAVKPARGIVLDAAGVELKRLELPSEVGELTFMPDGTSLATVSHSGKQVAIQVWNVEARRVDATCQFSTARESKYAAILRWSPDSKRMLVWINSELLLIDARGGEPIWRVDFGTEFDVRDAAFRSDAKRILVALDHDRMVLLDANDGRALDELDTIPVYRFAWAADGTRLFTSGLSGATEVWDVSRFASR